MRTLGDLAAFAKDAEAAIALCDKNRAAVVEIVDGAQAKPKKRWPF